jgi:hypothetical protein
MRLSNHELQQISLRVRDHIHPFIFAKGYVTDEELKQVLRQNIGRNVCSTRSLRHIQEYLANETFGLDVRVGA